MKFVFLLIVIFIDKLLNVIYCLMPSYHAEDFNQSNVSIPGTGLHYFPPMFWPSYRAAAAAAVAAAAAASSASGQFVFFALVLAAPV